MPIYEYQCTDCGHRLEALQKLNADPLMICPVCQHSTLRKLVSAPSFRLKGSGWYETDFKQSGKKHLADSSDSSAESSPVKADETSASASAVDKNSGAADVKKESDKVKVDAKTLSSAPGSGAGTVNPG